MTTSPAATLLKNSTWFKEASPAFLDAIGERMELVDVPDGHIFVKEGDPVTNMVLLQEGRLARSKLSVEGKSLKETQDAMSDDEIMENSVVVDEIGGRGRTSGLLHTVHEDSAFATVSASGPSKVWLLKSDDFREVVSSTPQFSLDFMTAMARELRSGSKSLRSLAIQAKNAGMNGDHDNGNICRVLCYDATSWTTDGFKHALEAYAKENKDLEIQIDYTSERLNGHSATYAAGYDAVCLFVNDTANAAVLKTLSLLGVKLVLMRCAGFDRVDTKAALAYDLTVARVPAYSPYAVAEMGIALLMAVNRKINKASNRVRMANFTLDAGLMGIDVHGKTVGVMGTGKIGQILCDILHGFGANLICYDVFESDEVKAKGGKYMTQDEVFAQSDILFLMTPLLPATHHTINASVLPKLKKGVILINTSRGGLIDTKALLEGLRTGIIGGVGMDVYENEQQYFFQDWSGKTIQDPDLEALLGNNNVVLTAHQAFFTKEAVDKIIGTTLENIENFHKGLHGLSHPNNCIPQPKKLTK